MIKSHLAIGFGLLGENIKDVLIRIAAHIIYNIIKRIFVGVGCEFATVRRVYLADGSIRIPGFGEPYFSAEFLYSRGLSFWLKGSRLTGQTVQRTPLYAERGPELTAGVRLSFGK